tara:strand:+ start:1657 stop:2577 length:921 start_codon:yes stop_codon:yes gene_type:complete
MNLIPLNQTKLYGLNKQFNELTRLYDENKLPNKILLSGLKGIGKSTLAYHLINYVLSKKEDNPYDLKNLKINIENRSYKLIQNGTNPNFYLIDVNFNKKNIDINQIRTLINDLNKSSFNSKPRFVLIDNIEYLNLSSINALLKILEEPNENIHFILIHNNKKIISTLLSRCLNFKISLTNKEINEITYNLFNENINQLINHDLLDYYYTPGKIYALLKLSTEKEINLMEIDIKKFLSLLINESLFKQDHEIKSLLYDMTEFFLLKKVSVIYSDISTYFLKRIEETKKFNLDDESLFLEINSKLLNE